jgi:hypothetical protein
MYFMEMKPFTEINDGKKAAATTTVPAKQQT